MAERIIPSLSHTPKPLLDRAARKATHALLGRLTHGRIRLIEEGQTFDFGHDSAPEVTVWVYSPIAYRLITTGGSAGLGEGYIAGHWDTDDLTALMQLLIRNTRSLEAVRTKFDRATGLIGDATRRLKRADKSQDRRNIHAHYDLSNDFFELFLDDTMTYSSAYWGDKTLTLREAQVEKIDRLCRDLELAPGDHLLEIGTGWGALAMHAAEHYRCRVTTTTLSREQFDYATKLVHDRGLVDRVTVLNDDYRDLTGTYDKIVSVEMIEAVDWRQHDVFFRKCQELLRPTGLMALQAIVIDERRYERAKTTNDFIKSFIFPGGCLPSVGAINNTIGRSTDFSMIGLDDFGLDYARTLNEWRGRLGQQRHHLADLGMDDQFERMWDFYLQYCEGAFRERHVSVVHALLARPGYRAA